jgi:hypothetical protein
LHELADQIAKENAAKPFGVWPDNWPALTAFLAVDTQWRAVPAGMSGLYWIGLDYTAVETGLKAAAIDATPSLWAGLRTIERAARDALNGIKG